MVEKKYDLLQRRCPRLGGPITFQYCRETGEGGLPCWKVVDCWWEYFDVLSVLKENLPAEKFNRILTASPKPKITSLIELAQAAKKRCES